MKYVDIASRFGDVTLRVTPVAHPWDTAAARPAFDVQLTAPNLDVSVVAIEDDEAPQTLIAFCRELADEHKGFDYDKRWESLGGDLKIRADHDQINATRLYVTLSGGVVPRWTASAELHVDPLRFDRVAINLGLFGDALIAGEVEDPHAEPQRIDPRQRAREPKRRIGTPNPQPSSG
jgi:hypothetical protein